MCEPPPVAELWVELFRVGLRWALVGFVVQYLFMFWVAEGLGA